MHKGTAGTWSILYIQVPLLLQKKNHTLYKNRYNSKKWRVKGFGHVMYLSLLVFFHHRIMKTHCIATARPGHLCMQQENTWNRETWNPMPILVDYVMRRSAICDVA